MCGRFYIEPNANDYREIFEMLQKKLKGSETFDLLKTSGEIFPGDTAVVQVGNLRYAAMKWGFSGFDNKLIINARMETAEEKPLFKQAIKEHRCLILASGYYEWHKEGNVRTKYRFYHPDSPLALAGFYRQEKTTESARFVILTKAADDDIKEIHDRMPVIIPSDLQATWLEKGLSLADIKNAELRNQAV